MKAILYVMCIIALLAVFSPISTLAAPLAADMISPKSDGGQCLTVNGADPTTAPGLVLDSCRGTPQQMWTHDSVSGKWQTGLDANYCLAANSTNPGTALNVRLCADSRALTLEPNPTLTDSWRIVSTTNVIDWGVYGVPAVASQNGWSYQLFSWLQPDVDVVNTQGCAIPYPLLVTDSAGYARELACDHIAKVQPPYYNANALRDPGVWPGTVASGAVTVTRAFSFNLQFKDNSYMRISYVPRNWQSTGLYAPAGQVITVTVSGATASELNNVYAQLGVHTDILNPTQANVTGPGQFNRYPNVTNKVKLVPGDNLVRTPYGGAIELVSNTSVSKTIDVTITGAVETPHFVLGTTTEADWLVQRDRPGPWAEFESDLAVLFVKSTDVRTLSYVEALGVAQYYRDVVDSENQLMGLTADVAVNQLPQGQQRFANDIQISAGAAHSGYPQMFGNYPMASPMATFQRSHDMSWGNLHELGHNNQQGAWANVYGTESTNNMFSLYGQEQLFGMSRMVDGDSYATTIAMLNNPAIPDKWNTGDGVTDIYARIIFLDQIRLGFPDLNWDFYRQSYRYYRALTSTDYNAINTNDLRYDTFMRLQCDLTNANLTPHFDAYMVPVTQAAKDYCATKPALTRQLWLIDGAKPLWYHAGSGSGGFLREYWNGINGTSLSNLTGNAAYPNTPTGSEILTTSLEGRQNFGDNYGERLRAYLYPPVTGDYRFWLSGDDSVQLNLSTDENPANASPMITLTTAMGYRDFDAFALSVQRSTSITLQAGQRYYIEVLHKEATGGDSVSVAWNIPAAPGMPGEVRKVIAAQFLSPYAGDLAVSETLVAGQPTPLQPGSDVTFQIQVTNNSSAPVHDVQVVDTLPISFTLNPADPNGWSSGFRYVRFRALSEAGNRGQWASMAELGLLDGTGAQIAKTGWLVTYYDNQQNSTDQAAANAIDNDPNTIWHTAWSGTPGYPHEIQVDTGAVRTLIGFTYLPRQDGGYNGRVGDYQFRVSEDGVTWIQVAQGTFADTSLLKTVNFSQPAPTRAYATLAGPIAPGASVPISIVLRSATGLADGAYSNTAGIVTALDSINSRIYDSNPVNDSSSASVQLNASNAPGVTIEAVSDGEVQQFNLVMVTIQDIADGNTPGLTTITRRSTPPGGGLPDAGDMPFWIDIAAATGAGLNANLTLCYTDAEIPVGVTEGNLVLYRYAGGGLWTNMGFTTRDTTGNCVTLNGVTGFSAWTLADPGPGGPTAITLNGFTVRQSEATDTGLVILIGAVLSLSIGAVGVWRMRQRRSEERSDHTAEVAS